MIIVDGTIPHQTIEGFGGERVIFGSGSPYFDQRYEVKRVNLAKVDTDFKEIVGLRNAFRLLNLEGEAA